MENVTPKKLGIVVLAAFLSLVMLTIVWYLATHGRLVVERNDDSRQYTVVKADQEDETSEEGDTDTDTALEVPSYTNSSIIIKSGYYIVRYDDGKRQHAAYVEVPSFLRAATVSFTSGAAFTDQGKSGLRHVERVAAKTLDYIGLGKGGAIVSFDTAFNAVEDIMVHPPNDPTGLSATFTNVPFGSSNKITNNNRLIGLVLSEIRGAAIEGGEAGAQLKPALYNMATGKVTEADKTYSSPSLVGSTSANNNYFGVIYVTYNNSEQFIKLDVFDGATYKQTFSNLSQTANGAGEDKAVGISENYVAMGFGEDFTSFSGGGEAGASSPPSKDYVVKVFNIANKNETASINIGKNNKVAGVQVNGNGTYISVAWYDDLFNAWLSVYDTSTGDLVFKQETALVSPPQWLDSRRLIFASSEGLYQLNTETAAAATLFEADTLSINSFEIVGNKILFTAYSQYAQEKGLSVPDGYIAYLDEEAKNDNQLVTQLPLDTENFTVSTLRQTIYVAPEVAGFSGPNPEFRAVNNPSAEFQQTIRDFLADNFENYEQYELVFGENL